MEALGAQCAQRSARSYTLNPGETLPDGERIMATGNQHDAFLHECFHAVDGSTEGREDLHTVGLLLGYQEHTSDALGAELAADGLLTLHAPHAYQLTEKGRQHVLESLAP
jgi:hypothetical protein